VTDKQRFHPTAYVIAGLALAIMDMSADEARLLNRRDNFKELFKSIYGFVLSDDVVVEVLDRMKKGGLLDISDDEFAGVYITLQKTSFSSQFKSIGESIPESPMGMALKGKRPWLDSVFNNETFWKELSSFSSADASESENNDFEVDIPASDRIVTLLHNSPERIEIEAGMQRLSETLRTNNEIASELGEDRERLSAEFEAANVGIKTERIRAGFISDTVLRILRELGTKLKDKAIDLGVERLVALFEILLGNLF
jgi:hypothetical protein